MIFAVWNLENIWHQKLINLTTLPVSCSHFTFGNPKSHFQQCYWYILLIICVISARQCTSTSCLWHSQASVPCDTPVHQPWHVVSQKSWSIEYHIWGMMQERVYWVPICSMNELRQRLVETWVNFSTVDDVTDQWRKRLSVCVDAGHFERCSLDIQVATHHNRQATNIWRKTIYLKLDEQVLHFTRWCTDIFQMWWTSSQLQFIFFSQIMQIIKSKCYSSIDENDFFWISQGVVTTADRWGG